MGASVRAAAGSRLPHRPHSGATNSGLAAMEREAATMSDLIPIEKAAELVGLWPATLRALIERDRFMDPIGDAREVYDDSRLRRLQRKPA